MKYQLTLRDLQNMVDVAQAVRNAKDKDGGHVIGTMHIDRFEETVKKLLWDNIRSVDSAGGGGSGESFCTDCQYKHIHPAGSGAGWNPPHCQCKCHTPVISGAPGTIGENAVNGEAPTK